MNVKHGMTVGLALLVSAAFAEAGAAQTVQPIRTVRARIYNDTEAEIRVKIIPYNAYQLPFFVDLDQGGKGPLILNLLTGNRVVIVFDRDKQDARLTRLVPVKPDKDLRLRVKKDPKSGEFDLAVEVVEPKERAKPKSADSAKKKAYPKKKAKTKKKARPKKKAA